MYYNQYHWLLLFLITAGFSCTTTTSEENSSEINAELSAEQIFCIQDIISSTPNVDKAKVVQVMFAFGKMHFGVKPIQTTAGALDLLKFGLREKHTNLTQSQWNAALGGTDFIQHIQNITLLTENDMTDFVQTVASVVDAEQKANIDRIFGDLYNLDRFSARWYLFSMAVKNSLGIDPAPFHALLHGDPNNTLCSNATITERYGNREKRENMTDADIYGKCFEFAKHTALVDMDKVKQYVILFAKVNSFTPPFATVAESDGVLEVMHIRYANNLTLSDWRSMFKSKDSDNVINIFADGSLTKSNLTTYRDRIKKVLPSEETDRVIWTLMEFPTYDQDQFRSRMMGFEYDAIIDVNNMIDCWYVKDGIPYSNEEGYCLNKKSYCTGNIDRSSVFYVAEYCADYVV